MADLNYLLAALNRALLDSGGSLGMNAQNTQIHNLANGTASGDAVNLGQLASLNYLPLTGGTLTGPLNGTSISLSAGLSCTTLSASGALTPGSLVNCAGYLGVPSNAQTTNYTLALSDAGTGIDFNGSNLTCTVPANASVSFPIGTVVMITNLNGTNLTISSADTLTISGTTQSGSRTLGRNGECKLRKVATTTWLISGTSLS
jgi:hypothetical protein